MKNKLKDKKVQLGITIATVLIGAISGLGLKKAKDKRREQRLLQELEDSSFENLDIQDKRMEGLDEENKINFYYLIYSHYYYIDLQCQMNKKQQTARAICCFF